MVRSLPEPRLAACIRLPFGTLDVLQYPVAEKRRRLESACRPGRTLFLTPTGSAGGDEPPLMVGLAADE